MKISVLGSGGCTPEIGRESPCLLINGRHIVDTGWNAAFKMREYGHDPGALETVFLTHLHMDHYLGLPGLMFSMGLRNRGRQVPLRLTVAGPEPGLADLVKRAAAFLRWDVYTHLRLDLHIHSLAPGATFENEDLAVRTFSLEHSTSVGPEPRPIDSLGYLFTERRTSQTFATAWDTSFCPNMIPHVSGQSILFHDAGHCSAAGAADIAQRAGVRRLYLVHYGMAKAEQLLKDARAVFPNTLLAREGETVDCG